MTHPRGPRSLSTHLKTRLHLHGVKAALLHELLAKPEVADPATMTSQFQALPGGMSQGQSLRGRGRPRAAFPNQRAGQPGIYQQQGQQQ